MMPSLYSSVNFLPSSWVFVRNPAAVCGFNQFQSLVLARELLLRRLHSLGTAELDSAQFCSSPHHFGSSFQFSSKPSSLSAIALKDCCVEMSQWCVNACDRSELFTYSSSSSTSHCLNTDCVNCFSDNFINLVLEFLYITVKLY